MKTIKPSAEMLSIIPIVKGELPPPVVEALRNKRITCYSKLAEMNHNQLYAIRGIGKVAIRQIEEALEMRGFRLQEPPVRAFFPTITVRARAVPEADVAAFPVVRLGKHPGIFFDTFLAADEGTSERDFLSLFGHRDAPPVSCPFLAISSNSDWEERLVLHWAPLLRWSSKNPRKVKGSTITIPETVPDVGAEVKWHAGFPKFEARLGVGISLTLVPREKRK